MGTFQNKIRTVQVIVKGLPATTFELGSGWPIGFPLGFEPTGFWLHAEARPMKEATTKVAIEKCISRMGINLIRFCNYYIYDD